MTTIAPASVPVDEESFSPGITMYAAERATAGEGRERDNEFYFLSFRLKDEFIEPYKTRAVNWGFPVGGNVTLGELTFINQYSRKKLDGTKERWWETCRRVIDGMYSIQKDHATRYRLPWKEEKAHRSAEEAYERLFVMKWMPPGRGLWALGTFFVNGKQNSAATQNCSFISTAKIDQGDPAFPFCRLMEQSMLGVGVGFDVLGAGKLVIHEPRVGGESFLIPDSREGWVESTRMVLQSYFLADYQEAVLDYSIIRPNGSPIKGFGGTAAGPDPLIQLHQRLRNLFGGRSGELITSTDLVDVMNIIGRCVVAANVRSSAEIALGSADDEGYMNLKNPMVNPVRLGFEKNGHGPLVDGNGNWVMTKEGGWGYTSNNSVVSKVGGNYDRVAELARVNGEPGLIWLDVARSRGRLADPADTRDRRISGPNPCSEQMLEDNELCTLCEIFPTNCDDKQDFLRTCKFGFLYGKTITLLMTHWAESNEVMIRNRRIGTGISGIAQFAEKHGWAELRVWQDEGYKTIREWDRIYSEWLGVRESVRVTTVKPSGSTSLLAGVTPGAHFPVERDRYLRRLRLTRNDPVAMALLDAGFPMEPNVQNPQFGLVVTCPTEGPDVRPEREATVWEKVALAVQCQEWWSDNGVSLTATFLPHEGDQLTAVLRAFEGKLKAISFLPLMDGETPYAQMPYERTTREEWEKMRTRITDLDWERLYAGAANEAIGERGCSTDTCELKAEMV